MNSPTSAIASLINGANQRQARDDQTRARTAQGANTAPMGQFVGQQIQNGKEEGEKKTFREYMLKRFDTMIDPVELDQAIAMGHDAAKALRLKKEDDLQTRIAAGMAGHDSVPAPINNFFDHGQGQPGAQPQLPPTSVPNFAPRGGPQGSFGPGMDFGAVAAPTPAAPQMPTTPPNISMPGAYGLNAPPPSGPRSQISAGGDATLGNPRPQGMMDGMPFGDVAPPQAPVAPAQGVLPNVVQPTRRQMEDAIRRRYAAGVGGFDAGALEGALGTLPAEPAQARPQTPEEADESRARADSYRASAEKDRREPAEKPAPRTPYDDQDIPDDLEEGLEKSKGLAKGALSGKTRGDFRMIPEPKETKERTDLIPDDVAALAETKMGLAPGTLKGKTFQSAALLKPNDTTLPDLLKQLTADAMKTKAADHIDPSETDRFEASLSTEDAIEFKRLKAAAEGQSVFGVKRPPKPEAVQALNDFIAKRKGAAKPAGASLGDVPAPTGSPPPKGPDPVVSPQAAAAAGTVDPNAGATPDEMAKVEADPTISASWKAWTVDQKKAFLDELRKP